MEGTIAGGNERRLPNWIDSFIRFSSPLSSPEIFRKWAGISIIAAAVERKVWARTMGSNLYPNLYTILVGPPGVGKSNILSQAERVLRAITDIHVSPSSLTTASLVDTMADSTRTNGSLSVTFNSLQVVASELGVFLPKYDSFFTNLLTKFYDGEFYEERRRTGRVEHVKIDHPQLSILGGTTPGYLNSLLPDGAWDQGFTSRTIFVFHGETVHPDIFCEQEDELYTSALFADLIHDLTIINHSFGKMEWTQEAMDAISAWANAGCPPVPEHGKLTHYNSRRLAHCIKLSITASIARSSKLEIELDDYNTALDWLLEAEDLMPEIFKKMGVSTDARAMEDLYHIVYKLYVQTKNPIAESVLVAFLKDRVPSYSIMKIIEMMVKSGLFKQTLTSGLPFYTPLPKV